MNYKFYSQDPWFQRYHRFEASLKRVINKVINPKNHQGNPVFHKNKYTFNFIVEEKLGSNKSYFYLWQFLYPFYRRQKLVPTIKPSPQKLKRWIGSNLFQNCIVKTCFSFTMQFFFFFFFVVDKHQCDVSNMVASNLWNVFWRPCL